MGVGIRQENVRYSQSLTCFLGLRCGWGENNRSVSHFGVPSVFVVVQLLSCVRLCDPMDCSIPDFPVLPHLPELAQTYVH